MSFIERVFIRRALYQRFRYIASQGEQEAHAEGEQAREEEGEEEGELAPAEPTTTQEGTGGDTTEPPQEPTDTQQEQAGDEGEPSPSPQPGETEEEGLEQGAEPATTRPVSGGGGGEVVTIDGIPVLEDIAEEPELVVAEEEEGESREELMEKIQAAMAEKNRLEAHNNQIQSEIAEYLARKKVREQLP